MGRYSLKPILYQLRRQLFLDSLLKIAAQDGISGWAQESMRNRPCHMSAASSSSVNTRIPRPSALQAAGCMNKSVVSISAQERQLRHRTVRQVQHTSLYLPTEEYAEVVTMTAHIAKPQRHLGHMLALRPLPKSQPPTIQHGSASQRNLQAVLAYTNLLQHITVDHRSQPCLEWVRSRHITLSLLRLEAGKKKYQMELQSKR